MKKSRFTEEQMVGMLHEADRTSVAAVAKAHGVNEQRLYTWRQRFGGMGSSDVKQLRQLEQDNNGPESGSYALLRWGHELGIALIEPGKPWQNGVAESFNGKFCDECLSMECFRSGAEAKVVIESWWHHYNDVRLHSSLGNLTQTASDYWAARPSKTRPFSRNEWPEEPGQVNVTTDQVLWQDKTEAGVNAPPMT